jgi:lanthionine synthetase-like protein
MAYREVGEEAWAWVLGQLEDDDGPWLPVSAGDGGPAADRDSVYAGIGGLAPVLAEIAEYREWTPAERALADAIVARLTAQATARTEPSLYDGLAGDATALRLLAPGTEQLPLARLAKLAQPDGWPSAMLPDGPYTDLIQGTAGVVLVAAWVGGEHAAELMTAGAEALLAVAEPAGAGLDWRQRPGYRSSTPNYSHGTAGVAAALAIAGHALRRADLLSVARRGARHLLDVGSLQRQGFIVPHTFPPSTRDVEPVTYGWCHGPTGTSLLFAALEMVGMAQVAGYGVRPLRERCLHSVLTSGLPARLRPGFWDNDGRCCGTAGVGDALLDAAQASLEAPQWTTYLAGAATMGDALLERAVRDEDGARWRFIEHRQDPPLLPPGTGWMQGAAGIATFLLRLERVLEQGPTAPVVDRPDQWWAVPDDVRRVHRSFR